MPGLYVVGYKTPPYEKIYLSPRNDIMIEAVRGNDGVIIRGVMES